MTDVTATPTPTPEESMSTVKKAAKKKAKNHGDKKRSKKAKVASKAKKKAKKLKVRASDQGIGGAVIGEKLKSQMMRIDPRLGEYIRREAKRLTKETGKHHNSTDAARSLYGYLKEKAVKLKPFHTEK